MTVVIGTAKAEEDDDVTNRITFSLNNGADAAKQDRHPMIAVNDLDLMLGIRCQNGRQTISPFAGVYFDNVNSRDNVKADWYPQLALITHRQNACLVPLTTATSAVTPQKGSNREHCTTPKATQRRVPCTVGVAIP
ncbi:hypothetical protein NE237_026024 [Protea cynaroides]|uniref:Uncharacterized protein n=1 Tax=Protea cynaroides TaxID=273540 RepID=A0A9Q0H5Y3_9MAGN|nr:hypothetical protein NE237_026024 [Protea cynaroides]